MKQIFRLSAKEVGTLLSRHVVKENGWENELVKLGADKP